MLLGQILLEQKLLGQNLHLPLMLGDPPVITLMIRSNDFQ
jgi:hypothetical protein